MVAEVDAATALVVIVNVVLVAPAGTVTLAGTVAAAVLLLDSVTCAPAGAGPSRGAGPVEVLPPPTVVGARAREGRGKARFTGMVARAAIPLFSAAMVAGAGRATSALVSAD